MNHDHDTESTVARQTRYESLVMPHLDRLLGFAIHRTPEVNNAEDAIQEICIRAWVAFDELRDAHVVLTQ